jgi:hypothetical protein
MDELLTDKEYQLERFSGKGGWTYVSLPEIARDKEAAFGIVKVKGTIDAYEFNGVTLMPFNGGMIIAVKASIRKVIGKEEGDYVHVILYRDTAPFVIPEDFKLILQQESGAYERFIAYKKWEQRMCINWIYSAKRPETVKERIAKTIFKVLRREKII